VKVSIDDDRCRGHGVCAATCPEVFELADGGYAEVIDPASEVPAEHQGAVLEAVAACPERAISTS
jgi:ferredoxin